MLIKQIWMKISGIIVYNKKKTRCYFHSISEIMWGVGKWRGCGRAGNSLIRSNRSEQMSHHERFAQIAQNKWATVSISLRSHMKNERSWAIRSGCSEKMSDLLRSLTKNERFAHVAHQKWANVRDSLRSLSTKE